MHPGTVVEPGSAASHAGRPRWETKSTSSARPRPTRQLSATGSGNDTMLETRECPSVYERVVPQDIADMFPERDNDGGIRRVGCLERFALVVLLIGLDMDPPMDVIGPRLRPCAQVSDLLC